jgi:hypothetical protein
MKKLFPLLLFVILFIANAFGQNDSIPDNDVPVQDTLAEKSSEKKAPKRVSDFKIYGGISTSKILLSNSSYESANAAGYLLGFAYRKGKFGYWEIGLNYNNSAVSLAGTNALQENMQLRQLEVPLSAGINLLSLTRRVLGVRLFGGLVPGYIAGISDNPFNLVVDDFNRFQLGGRAGVGVDVLFLFFEAGYQYGFIDVLNDQSSNLSQVDFRLGFRF